MIRRWFFLAIAIGLTAAACGAFSTTPAANDDAGGVAPPDGGGSVDSSSDASATTSDSSLSSLEPIDVSNAKLPSGLVLRVRFDEGTGAVAADSVGGRDVAFRGQATWQPGISSSALSLNGTTAFATIGPNPPLSFSNDLTIAAWIKLDILATHDQRVFSRQYNWELKLNDRKPQFTFPGGNYLTSNAEVDSNWHHVAVVFNAGNVAIYVDAKSTGVHEDHIDGGGGAALLADDSTEPFIIGISGGADVLTAAQGLIDDIQLYNRALSEVEVAKSYAAR